MQKPCTSAASVGRISLMSVCIPGVKFLSLVICSYNYFMTVKETGRFPGNQVLWCF